MQTLMYHGIFDLQCIKTIVTELAKMAGCSTEDICVDYETALVTNFVVDKIDVVYLTASLTWVDSVTHAAISLYPNLFEARHLNVSYDPRDGADKIVYSNRIKTITLERLQNYLKGFKNHDKKFEVYEMMVLHEMSNRLQFGRGAINMGEIQSKMEYAKRILEESNLSVKH
jgi:NADPH-dependent 7-cyano-7-deazaguanine reductase QueF